MSNLAYSWLQRIMITLAMIFIFVIVKQHFAEILSIATNLDWLTFSFSTLLALFLNSYTAAIYSRLLSGHWNSLSEDLPNFFISQLSKYIPGKIWSVTHQKVLFAEKHSTTKIIRTNIVLTYLQLFNCIAVGFVVLSFVFNIWLGIAAFSISLLTFNAIRIKPFNSLIRLTSKLFSGLEPFGEKSMFPIIAILSYCTVFIILFSTSHSLLSFSSLRTDLSDSYILAAVLAIGWVMGVLTIITPAGIGTREISILILGSLLSSELGIESLTALALISRLWMVMLDILSGIIAITYKTLHTDITKERKI